MDKETQQLICYKCGSIANKLCDGLIEGRSKTCDRALCSNCAHHTGQGIACVRGKGGSAHGFAIDYCDECFQARERRKQPAAKATPPKWLQKGVLACHIPTATVFKPDRLFDRNNTLHLTDSNGDEWKLSECDRLQLEHLRKGGTFASELTIAIYPDPRGLIVSDGRSRRLIILPVSDFDDAEEAALSLARAFNGSVYSEEVTA